MKKLILALLLLVSLTGLATARVIDFTGLATSVADTDGTQTTNPIAVHDYSTAVLCLGWSGADSVAVTLQGSIDGTNWATLVASNEWTGGPLLGGTGYDIYIQEMFAVPRIGTSQSTQGPVARLVRLTFDVGGTGDTAGNLTACILAADK